jgi:superoxide dismutase, Fe-Mn family
LEWHIKHASRDGRGVRPNSKRKLLDDRWAEFGWLRGERAKKTNPPLLCERRRASIEYSGVVQQVESPMTMNTERRKFIAGVGAAAASTAVLAGGQALAQGNQQIGAKAMPYQAKPIPFDAKSITGISEKVLVSHYENNYVGAVKRLNAIGTQLAELDFAKVPIFVINGLKREELVASNSMILHEIYFDGLGGGARASGPLADAIARDFGSMERWRSEFVAMGKAEGGGSGWVILAYSPRDKRLVNQWAADHTTTLAGGRPVLVLDMYEHAYHMDYGAAAARYVDVYMEAIRWDNAAKLYEQYSRET